MVRYDVPKVRISRQCPLAYCVIVGSISLSHKKPIFVLGIPGLGLFAAGLAMGLNLAQNVTGRSIVTSDQVSQQFGLEF